MAVIPLQVAERRLDTGNVVSYPQGSPIGAAVEGAGDQFQAVAERVKARQDELDNFKRITVENSYDQDMANQAAEAARNGAADGSGLHDTIVGQVDPSGRVVKPGLFDRLAQKYRDQVPESQRGFFDASLPAKRLQLSGSAASAQYEQEQKYATLETTKIQNGLVASILQMDPNDSASYDAYKAKGRDAILASPLSPLAKQATLDGWDQAAPKALAEAISARDPGKLRELFGMAAPSASDGTAVDVVTDKIVGVESGGDPNAENPNSSASGVGQFLDSTWVQTIRQHRPDIAAGKSAAQLIALKKDRKLGREMTRAYQLDNADYLANRGEATTPGNIYLAHFLGPGGAVNTLKADPNTPIVDVVGQDVVNANPFLRGKTASDTIAWADKKMGSAGASAKPDPRFQGLSPDDMLSLANRDDVAFRQKQTADIAQSKVEYQGYKDHIELGIRTGEIRDPALILNSKLNEGDQASLYEMLRTQNKDSAGVDAIIGAIGSGQKVSINSFDSDQTKIADKAFGQFVAGVAPEQRSAATSTYVSATGYIPDQVQAQLRQGAASKTGPELSSALSQADTLERIAPKSFGNIPGSDVQTKLTDYRHLVNDLGMTGEAAAQEIIRRADPSTKASVEVLKPAAEKFLKGLTVGDVTNAFDSFTGPGGEPGAGVMPQQPTELLAEYKELAGDAFYETGGDAGMAKARAVAAIQKNWAVSNVSGSPNLMRMAPELYYPPVGDKFDYLRADAMQTAQAYVDEHHPGRKVENVAIKMGEWTRRDAEMMRTDKNRFPRYKLYYQFEDHGQTTWEEAYGAPWGVDAGTIDKARESEIAPRMQTESEGSAVDGSILRQAQGKVRDIVADPYSSDLTKALQAETTSAGARFQVDVRKDQRKRAAAPPLSSDEQPPSTGTYDGSQKTGFGGN